MFTTDLPLINYFCVLFWHQPTRPVPKKATSTPAPAKGSRLACPLSVPFTFAQNMSVCDFKAIADTFPQEQRWTPGELEEGGGWQVCWFLINGVWLVVSECWFLNADFWLLVAMTNTKLCWVGSQWRGTAATATSSTPCASSGEAAGTERWDPWLLLIASLVSRGLLPPEALGAHEQCEQPHHQQAWGALLLLLHLWLLLWKQIQSGEAPEVIPWSQGRLSELLLKAKYL